MCIHMWVEVYTLAMALPLVPLPGVHAACHVNINDDDDNDDGTMMMIILRRLVYII